MLKLHDSWIEFIIIMTPASAQSAPWYPVVMMTAGAPFPPSDFVFRLSYGITKPQTC